MKSGKDEEEQMEPLFPKFHISAAEKGGPRPPPRNKMALCETSKIPNQRFAPGSVSTFPLLPNSDGSLVPSTASNHHTGNTRSMFSSFGSSSQSTHLAARLDSYCSGGKNTNATLTKVTQQKETTNVQTLFGKGGLKSGNCHLSKPQCSTNSRTSLKKLRNENDYVVPTISQLGNPPNNVQQITSREKPTSSSTHSPGILPIACEKQQKETGTTDIKSRQHSRNQIKEKKLVFETSSNCPKNDALFFQDRFSLFESVNNNSEERTSFADESRTSHDANASLRDGVWAKPEKATRNASAMQGLSWTRQSDGNNNQSPNRIGAANESREEQDLGSARAGDVGENGNISDSSVVESIMDLNISPDNVVELIGQEMFWKARRTIACQQRVFAVQVYELHRLIKVQRSIAGSPDLFLEDKFHSGKPAIEVEKKLPSQNFQDSLRLIAKREVDSLKANNTVRKSPPLSNNTEKAFTQQSNCKPDSLISTPPLTGPDWFFHTPAANQWLVPVQSPSEGLVYKPCTGPFPPPAGLAAPTYGSCGPMSLALAAGNFLTAPYGFPVSNQHGISIFPETPLGQTYFPPCSMPVMKPSSSQSDKVNTNFTIPYKSSCTIPNQKKWAISAGTQNLHGSTASSSSERKQGRDELPLFPIAPAVKDLDQQCQNKSTDQRIQVIKVVPRNPKLASVSAARIFQSIQEERKQHD